MTSTAPSSSPVTVRAVCTGLFFTILIDLFMTYNDYYLSNALLIGNHFPYISLVLILGLVFLVNIPARRFFHARGYSSGELLLIWGMIGIGGGMASSGFMRYMPGWIAAPAYYATAANEYQTYILRYIPDWMLVSKDPDSTVIRWYFEGLPRGERLPWRPWLLPLAVWSSFAALCYAVCTSLSAIFLRQWSDRERLVFPIVHLPLQIAQSPGSGRWVNDYLKNPVLWAGAAIPILIYTLKAMHTFYPQVPDLPLSWSTFGLFPDRPWSEFNMQNATVYFYVIGMTFLLTTEISFSMWFFYFLYRLSYVFIAWYGAAGGASFWSDWGTKVSVFESGGGVLVVTVFLFWSARQYLREWMGRALTLRRDPDHDPVHPTVTLAFAAAGFGGMLVWTALAGVPWWAAIFAVTMFLSILLVLTRIIAESGMLIVNSGVIPYNLMRGLFPASWITGPMLNVLMIHKAIFSDFRETQMPYAMNGLRAADQGRLKVGQVFWVFMLTMAVAFAVSAYGHITTCYKYGAYNMDQWAHIWSPRWNLQGAADYLKNPPEYPMMTLGGKSVLPVHAAHVASGGVITAVLFFLRARFAWWPFHPFGFVMCASWGSIWFSFFLGWFAKTAVMQFGGASAYRRILPFFMGLLLGDCMVAAFWMVVSVILKTPIISNMIP